MNVSEKKKIVLVFDDVKMSEWCVWCWVYNVDVMLMLRYPNACRFSFCNQIVYLDDPIRMYACHGNEPNPASSPPTIRLWAVCLANDMPQPTRQTVQRIYGILVFFPNLNVYGHAVEQVTKKININLNSTKSLCVVLIVQIHVKRSRFPVQKSFNEWTVGCQFYVKLKVNE